MQFYQQEYLLALPYLACRPLYLVWLSQSLFSTLICYLLLICLPNAFYCNDRDIISSTVLKRIIDQASHHLFWFPTLQIEFYRFIINGVI